MRTLSSAQSSKLDYPIIFFDTSSTSDSSKPQGSNEGSNERRCAQLDTTARKIFESSRFLSLNAERARLR